MHRPRRVAVYGILVVALAALCAHAQEKIVYPEKEMNLNGTRPGPHYVYMTREERALYIKQATTDPKAMKEFGLVKDRADATLKGDAEDRDALVRTYIVTRDKTYFDAWRLRWLAESNRLNTLHPTPMKMAQAYGPRNRFIWGHTDMAWDYDMMAGDLSERDEKLLRWQLKKYCDALRIWKVDNVNVRGQSEGGNMAAQTIGITSPQWFVIGYDDCIKWSISHERGGWRDGGGGLLEWISGMRDKRVWGEAPVYQWYVGKGMRALSECAWRYDGTDVWNMTTPNGTKPRNILDGMVDMAFPLERTGIGIGSIRMANFGEAGTSLWADQWLNVGLEGYREYGTWQDVLRSVYRASKDKGYGWLASVNRGVGEPEGEPVIDPDTVSPPLAPSSVWPTAGIAMLRADESPDYWMGRTLAMQIMGGEKRRSAPGDSFSIRLHGAGRLLYPDWAMTYYEVYNNVGWERAGIRRNSIMIDGRETSLHRTLWRHAFWPEVKYLSLRASRYGHDRSERAFMMAKEYMLDVTDIVVGNDLSPDLHYYPRAGTRKQYKGWSRAGLWDENGKMPESHTFDYILHGIGQQFASHWWRFNQSTEMTTENWSNRWFDKERRADMGGDSFHVDWMQRSGGMERRLGAYYNDLGAEWFEDRAAVRMHMIGAPGTVTYTLQAPMGEGGHFTESQLPNPPTHVVDPDKHPEMTIKTLIVRRRGKAAQFAALHEPYREQPAITGFEYLQQPKVTDNPRTVGVKVTGPDYTDRLYLTLGLPGYSLPDGVQEARVALRGESPEVTVTSAGDAGEQVRFADQAYLRQKGAALIVRGDVRAFRVRAPGVNTATLNGKQIEVQRAGEYVLFGNAVARAGGPVRITAPATVAPEMPVEISLPQRFVNLDAIEGGWMVVRVTNRTDAPVSGSITLKPGAGLKVSAAKSFAAVSREQRIDLGFQLDPVGAKPGALVPVEAVVTCGDKTQTIKTQVAVGIVVQEVPRTYSIPVYNLQGNLPGKPKPKAEWLTRKFDYLRVRAPGYTLRVDMFSGGTRWIMDCTGLIRTSLAAYPYSLARVDETRYIPGQTLAGPWLKEAKYLGISKTAEGIPTLEFTSLDGNDKWNYVLTPESAGASSFGAIDVPGIAEQNGLGFKVPDQPWWKEEAVSIWPEYKLAPVQEEVEENPNLLAGIMPSSGIPEDVQDADAVYWDDTHKIDGLPSLCFDLEKSRGMGAQKVFITLDWPAQIQYEKNYRFTLKMRHENVTNIVTAEPMYCNWASTSLANWVSQEVNDSIYWPARVREWFLCHNRRAMAANTRNMHLRIAVPGDPEQTGKIWIGGFSVRQED